MIDFSYAAIVIALGNLVTVPVLMRRGTWKRHRYKVLAVALLGVILAIIGLIGVS